MPPKPAYRDLGALSWVLNTFLLLGTFAAAVGVLSSYLQLRLLQNLPFPPGAWEANAERQEDTALAQLAIFIPTGALFIAWMYRACRNVRAFGAQGLKVSPTWAVLSFFVPVFNLWKPYEAMRELWQASCTPKNWYRVPTGFLLPGWWLLWILSNGLSRLALRIVFPPDNFDRLLLFTYAELTSQVLEALLCVCLMTLVSDITRRQRHQGSIHGWKMPWEQEGGGR